MKNLLLNTASAIILASALFISCNCHRHTVTVSDSVINADFFGNGVEWDPYDEAISWGPGISDADWDKLYDRLNCLRPQYVRCMINSPYLYFQDGVSDSGKGYRFVPERNFRNIQKLLTWCENNSVSVIYGEFNPPAWSMKDSDEWVEMSVKYLNWLVEDNGFHCIRNFVIFNEPDGNWASTDGDFGLWQKMYDKFHKEMRKYPALDSVSLAGPDAVLNYSNPASDFDSYGWVAQTASGLDSLTGIYDIHCYPGQQYIRSGEFAEDVARIRSIVPKDKRFIFGEGGFKYHNPEDSTLMKEYWRRVEKTPFTDGSDCNMLVTDWFYALDMPIFAIEAMNNGASGVAAWMLDDAMHSNGDSGQPKDIKIWGMWNILGEEVFGDASLEDIRPWFYTWTMICRCFPRGCDIVKVNSDLPKGLFAAASKTHNGKYSAVFVNTSDLDISAKVSFPANTFNLSTCAGDNDSGECDTEATGTANMTGTASQESPSDQKCDTDRSANHEKPSDEECCRKTDSYRVFTFTQADSDKSEEENCDKTAVQPIEYCKITEQEMEGDNGCVTIPAMSFVAVTSLFDGTDSPFDAIKNLWL